MNVARETVYKAVWDAVNDNPTVQSIVKTSGRLLKPFTNLKPEHCPALFMVQKGEVAEHVTGLPIKWTLKVEFVLYVDVIDDLSALPATQSNAIMDAIEAALAPSSPSHINNLGGLAKYCSIEGQVLTDEGLLGPKAIWAVPVSILVP